MIDKKIIDLLENYISFGERKELDTYIRENNLSEFEYKTITLVLLNIKNLFDYIPCYNYRKVIKNITNKEFLDNEDNYMI